MIQVFCASLNLLMISKITKLLIFLLYFSNNILICNHIRLMKKPDNGSNLNISLSQGCYSINHNILKIENWLQNSRFKDASDCSSFYILLLFMADKKQSTCIDFEKFKLYNFSWKKIYMFEIVLYVKQRFLKFFGTVRLTEQLFLFLTIIYG